VAAFTLLDGHIIDFWTSAARNPGRTSARSAIRSRSRPPLSGGIAWPSSRQFNGRLADLLVSTGKVPGAVGDGFVIRVTAITRPQSAVAPTSSWRSPRWVTTATLRIVYFSTISTHSGRSRQMHARGRGEQRVRDGPSRRAATVQAAPNTASCIGALYNGMADTNLWRHVASARGNILSEPILGLPREPS
jgi:hypothetical protein